jgi:hypothetical protein
LNFDPQYLFRGLRALQVVSQSRFHSSRSERVAKAKPLVKAKPSAKDLACARFAPSDYALCVRHTSVKALQSAQHFAEV